MIRKKTGVYEQHVIYDSKSRSLIEHLQKDIFHYLSQEFQGIHPSLVKQKTIWIYKYLWKV